METLSFCLVLVTILTNRTSAAPPARAARHEPLSAAAAESLNSAGAAAETNNANEKKVPDTPEFFFCRRIAFIADS